MINAVSNADVPAISIIMGASYGAGNYAMCGTFITKKYSFSICYFFFLIHDKKVIGIYEKMEMFLFVELRKSISSSIFVCLAKCESGSNG
jgi:hypothetical protein